MRQISQIANQKPKNSKFFDYFVKKYGDTATRSASDDEIFKNLRSLYIDLCSGTCQSDKYVGYFYSDTRIFQILLHDAYKKVIKWHIIYNSLNEAATRGSQLITLPQVNDTIEDCRKKYFTYSTVYNCVTNFCQTFNPLYLTQISVNLSNKMNRDEQGQICL